MHVAVTGGSGNVGRWVVRALTTPDELGVAHEVTVFDAMPGPELPAVSYLTGDTADLGQVFGALSGADVVIHLAALRALGMATHEVLFRTNVVGTFNVHEAAWRLGIGRVVSTSSSSVLGWFYRERDIVPKYLPIDEEHPLEPQDAYGLSKAVGESIARSYSDRSDMVTVALRPPWIASPEDIQKVRADGGRPAKTFGSFDYVDVRDLARAYRRAVEADLEGHHAFYITADDSSVAEPLNELIPNMFPPAAVLAAGLTGTAPFITNARAKRFLAWSPQHSWRSPEPTD